MGIHLARRAKLYLPPSSGGGGGGYAAEVLADNPVAWWRLNETAGSTTVANEVSGAGNGTIIGTPALGVASAHAGNLGTALNCAPGGGVSLGLNTALRVVVPFTVEAWVYRTGSVSEGHVILTEAYAGDNTVRYILGRHGNGWGLGKYQNGWSGLSVSEPPANTWSHEMATVETSNNTARYYRNGVLIGGPTNIGDFPAGSETFYIGRRWDQSTYFPGRIDEVAVYNTALSAARALAHYNAGLA